MQFDLPAFDDNFQEEVGPQSLDSFSVQQHN